MYGLCLKECLLFEWKKMAYLNEVRLIGRLLRDPEMRQIPSGQTVTNLSIATNRKYKDSNGMMKEETAFVDISCWGRLAEIVHNHMRKGRQIFVGGRLRYESWDDKETGKKRSRLSVVADNVQFLDPKDGAGGSSGNYGSSDSYGGDSWNSPSDGPNNSAPDWNSPPMDEPPF